MTALQIVAAVVSLGVTAVAVALLVKTVVGMVATFALGQPDNRGDDKGARTRTLVREFLGHTRMSRLPVVAVAHWFTMVSFGVLFFTLLNAFGQLFKPDFALPLIGHFPPFEWVTEFFAWAGMIGILVLIGIRQKHHPRSAPGEGGRRSRFFGSTWWQAYYVEFTILGVTLCIVTLRALEYALAKAGGGAGNGGTTSVSEAGALHYPLTGWLGEMFTGTEVATLENAIVVVAAVKILISFAWIITIALVPTMGVAWHRFLAFFNIFFKRHADGRTSLAELQPIMV
ncbi:MAG: Fe-S oxidoreductase, partial [Terracoccus sp.]